MIVLAPIMQNKMNNIPGIKKKKMAPEMVVINYGPEPHGTIQKHQKLISSQRQLRGWHNKVWKGRREKLRLMLHQT